MSKEVKEPDEILNGQFRESLAPGRKLTLTYLYVILIKQ